MAPTFCSELHFLREFRWFQAASTFLFAPGLGLSLQPSQAHDHRRLARRPLTTPTGPSRKVPLNMGSCHPELPATWIAKLRLFFFQSLLRSVFGGKVDGKKRSQLAIQVLQNQGKNNGFRNRTWFAEEPGAQKAFRKYGFCVACIYTGFYDFCSGFQEVKTRFFNRNLDFDEWQAQNVVFAAHPICVGSSSALRDHSELGPLQTKLLEDPKTVEMILISSLTTYQCSKWGELPALNCWLVSSFVLPSGLIGALLASRIISALFYLHWGGCARIACWASRLANACLHVCQCVCVCCVHVCAYDLSLA